MFLLRSCLTISLSSGKTSRPLTLLVVRSMGPSSLRSLHSLPVTVLYSSFRQTNSLVASSISNFAFISLTRAVCSRIASRSFFSAGLVAWSPDEASAWNIWKSKPLLSHKQTETRRDSRQSNRNLSFLIILKIVWHHRSRFVVFIIFSYSYIRQIWCYCVTQYLFTIRTFINQNHKCKYELWYCFWKFNKKEQKIKS